MEAQPNSEDQREPERRYPELPDFETALGHLVLAGKITAEQAYKQMGALPMTPPKAA